MKNIKILLLIVTGLFFASCEEVVDMDLETAAPRLVIDASLNWVKGTDGSQQKIKLSTTTGYYETVIPAVSGATVFVTNSGSNTVFNFIEEPGTGEYNCIDFVPEIGADYVLTVIYNGQTYTAAEKLFAVPEITRTEQDNEGGFLGEDVEVRFFYQDDAMADNFYMTRYDIPSLIPYPDYDVIEDKFFQGNEMFGIYSHEDLEPGDMLHIKLHGISQRYYNYMLILISMVEGGTGSGPFQTPPVSLRGNIINQTDEANYALGYFRVSETAVLDYAITE